MACRPMGSSQWRIVQNEASSKAASALFFRAFVLSLRDGRPSVWIGPSFLGRIVLQQLWKSLKSSRVPSGVFWKFRRIT